MRQFLFHTESDWYTAQRILGKLCITYNSFKNDDGKYIIELLY